MAIAIYPAIDVPSALGDVIDELRDDIPASVERGLARMRAEAPEFFVRDGDPDFSDLNRQSYAQQLRFIYAGLADGLDVEEHRPPALATEEARAAAGLGITLSSYLLTCRIGQRLLFEEVIDKAHERIDEEDVRAAVLRHVSRWLFRYFDWLTVQMTEVYEHERDLLLRGRDRRRRQLVRRLLDGEPVDAGPLEYRLDRDHLALVAWGEDPERALTEVAAAGGFALLTVPGTNTTVWGWLAARAIGQHELAALGGLQPRPGTFLALGDPGRGAAGFRTSHRQAWAAYRLARPAPQPVTRHTDVALLALTLQDPDLAREFVLRELGPLAAEDERSEVLRATLEAYFAAGQNGTSAAAALRVHKRTVLYRLRSIEQRLGHPISARREELAVALRLRPAVLDR